MCRNKAKCYLAFRFFCRLVLLVFSFVQALNHKNIEELFVCLLSDNDEIPLIVSSVFLNPEDIKTPIK